LTNYKRKGVHKNGVQAEAIKDAYGQVRSTTGVSPSYTPTTVRSMRSPVSGLVWGKGRDVILTVGWKDPVLLMLFGEIEDPEVGSFGATLEMALNGSEREGCSLSAGI